MRSETDEILRKEGEQETRVLDDGARDDVREYVKVSPLPRARARASWRTH